MGPYNPPFRRNVPRQTKQKSRKSEKKKKKKEKKEKPNLTCHCIAQNTNFVVFGTKRSVEPKLHYPA
jgi:hypothetical protein